MHSSLSMKDRVRRSADALSNEAETFHPPRPGLQLRHDGYIAAKFGCDCERVMQTTAIISFNQSFFKAIQIFV